MAKGKGKGPKGGPYIKNSHLIGKGTSLPKVGGPGGANSYADAVRKQEAISKAKPSPQIKVAVAQQPVKQANPAPATPATKPPAVNVTALKASTSLTPPASAVQAKSPKLQKGASQLLASQKQAKPAVKPPAPAKKPPTPGR